MQMQDLTAGHGVLTAARTGEGPDIVVLHSLLADRTAFDPVLPALAAKHRVTLINLPGFHGSKPTPLALMDAYVAAIEDGFDEFEIGKDAVLIGNGFGGTVALAFAIAHPERISKLVLSDAAACFPPEGRQAFARDGEQGGRERACQRRRDRRPPRAFARISQEPSARRSSERKQMLLGIDPKGFAAACKILQETDLDAAPASPARADACRRGELDQATPPALNKAIVEKVAGSRYIELPGCGHCPPLEQPDAFLKAIKEFVGLVEPRFPRADSACPIPADSGRLLRQPR